MLKGNYRLFDEARRVRAWKPHTLSNANFCRGFIDARRHSEGDSSNESRNGTTPDAHRAPWHAADHGHGAWAQPTHHRPGTPPPRHRLRQYRPRQRRCRADRRWRSRLAMLDIGHNFRPSTRSGTTPCGSRCRRLKNSSAGHSAFASVRQSRLGVKATTPTAMGDTEKQFEIEMFGGLRKRHTFPCGTYGGSAASARADVSLFTDPDVFPNSVEHRGPTAWCSTATSRFASTPSRKTTPAHPALEQPGASGDAGRSGDAMSFQASGRSPMLDIRAYPQPQEAATSAPPASCAGWPGTT